VSGEPLEVIHEVGRSGKARPYRRAGRSAVSTAAEQYVQACTHPKVRGATRALLQAIAQLVPDGYTTTAAIGMDDLAAAAGLHRRTVLSRLEVLVTIGQVRVIDGGQGRVARYMMVELDGARPLLNVPLPLRADLQAVPPRVSSVEVDSDAAELVITSCSAAPELVITSWWRHVLVITSTFLKGFLTPVLVITSWGCRQLVITSTFFIRPLGNAPRARDVHTLKNVHTHTHGAAPRNTGPPASEPPGDPTPPPIVHPWHAWCGPLVCVPNKLHEDWRRKHPEAWLFAFYARTHAATPVERLRLVVDEFKFWRTALAAEFTPQATGAAPNARAAPSADLYARAAEERRRRQGSGFT
jgi:hypothetical protein